jgi:hypothetical protein
MPGKKPLPNWWMETVITIGSSRNASSTPSPWCASRQHAPEAFSQLADRKDDVVHVTEAAAV